MLLLTRVSSLKMLSCYDWNFFFYSPCYFFLLFVFKLSFEDNSIYLLEIKTLSVCVFRIFFLTLWMLGNFQKMDYIVVCFLKPVNSPCFFMGNNRLSGKQVRSQASCRVSQSVRSLNFSSYLEAGKESFRDLSEYHIRGFK